MSAKEITLDLGRTAEGYTVTAEVRREFTVVPRTSVTHEELAPGLLTVAVTFEVINPRKRGDNRYMNMGQVAPEDRVLLEPTDLSAAVERLWSRWHLNTMRAACVHQAVPEVPADVSAWDRSSWLLDNTPPCPVTGYRYGSAWLTVALDEQAQADLRLVFNQPRR